jgi:hypothetical protein
MPIMTVPTERSANAEIEIRGEKIERRRRWAVVFGLLGIVTALMLGGWFAVFMYPLGLVPTDWRIPSGTNHSTQLFWAGCWTLSAVAGFAGLVAVGLGIGGLARIHGESRILAVAGILLGAVTMGMVGCLGWILFGLSRAYIPAGY